MSRRITGHPLKKPLFSREKPRQNQKFLNGRTADEGIFETVSNPGEHYEVK